MNELPHGLLARGGPHFDVASARIVVVVWYLAVAALAVVLRETRGGLLIRDRAHAAALLDGDRGENLGGASHKLKFGNIIC